MHGCAPQEKTFPPKVAQAARCGGKVFACGLQKLACFALFVMGSKKMASGIACFIEEKKRQRE